MRNFSAILVLSVLSLGACGDVVSTQDSVAAEATVIDRLIGTRISTEGGANILINADGTLEGSTNSGDAIVGTYVADANEICSTLTAPASIAGDYCSKPVYEGDTVIFNRRNGTTSPLYTIEG